MIQVPLIVQWPVGIFEVGAAGGDILHMVVNAGLMVKLVLLILLIFSIISWAIILIKARLLRKARKETESFLDLFKEGLELKKIFTAAENYAYSPVARLFRSGYAEFNRLKKIEISLAGDEEHAPDSGALVWSKQTMMDNLKRALEKEVIEQVNRFEDSLGFLATTGNTAPFVGLFGTVWGIMESFRSIGLKGAANLAVVAPGISEALVATATGLAAAIPAVVAFNAFNQRVTALKVDMDIFTADFLSMVERQLLKRQGIGRPVR